MKFVIFGKSQSGRTTFFTLLTGLGEKKKRLAMVRVPDHRLNVLAEVCNSKKRTPINLAFVDPLPMEETSELRSGDAVLHIVRSTDPVKEVEKMEEEFISTDLESISLKLEKLGKEYLRRKDKEAEKGIEFFRKVKGVLENGKPLREEMEEEGYLKGLGLLSLKPIIHVINCKFEEIEKWEKEAKRIRGRMKGGFAIDARTELELLSLSDGERKELMEEFGINELKSEKFLSKAFEILELVVFYTPGEKETRAWEVRKGTRAIDAAGKIHSDIAQGFIKAEVGKLDEFVEAKGWSGLREKGKLHLEGKDYIVQDGDVIYFRFNK